MWPFRAKNSGMDVVLAELQALRAEVSHVKLASDPGVGAHPAPAQMPPDMQREMARSMAVLLGGDERPISFESPWLYKTAFTSTPKRKPQSTITTDTLRSFADNYDIVRDCIEHLKREARTVPLSIVAKDPHDDSKETEDAIEEAKGFFNRSGGLGGFGRTRRHFEAEIFEEAFVIGAYAVYLQPTRGGGVYTAESLQADTIIPIVDDRGWVDPDRAFFQVVNGVQRGGPYSLREIAYDGFHPVSNSPYFKSRVEYLVNVILAALKAHEWNLTWLTDGNVPDQLISVPKDWKPDQLMAYSQYFDELLSGNSRDRHKAKIVPDGTKPVWTQTRKDADFQEFERWLMERTCAIFGVHPTSIGFSSQVYKQSQSDGQDQTTQFGAGDVLELRKDLYDEILCRNGFDFLEVKNANQGEESKMEKATRLQIEVGKPWKSVNEARQELGMLPDPDPAADEVIAKPEEPDGDEGPEKTGKDKNPDRGKKSDMRRWQRKALWRAAHGRRPRCEFSSTEIPADEMKRIAAALDEAKTADDVRAIFAPLIEEQS